jgi:hypothetical protein
MRKFLRVVLVASSSLVIVVAAVIAFATLRPPKQRLPSTEKITVEPARIERGRYLAHHVTDCMGCHSDHHFERFGMPIKAGTEGQGGFAFDDKLGVPGVVCAQNITSDAEYGLGRWTDGEVLRAMREGVDREGRALSDDAVRRLSPPLRRRRPGDRRLSAHAPRGAPLGAAQAHPVSAEPAPQVGPESARGSGGRSPTLRITWPTEAIW